MPAGHRTDHRSLFAVFTSIKSISIGSCSGLWPRCIAPEPARFAPLHVDVLDAAARLSEARVARQDADGQRIHIVVHGHGLVGFQRQPDGAHVLVFVIQAIMFVRGCSRSAASSARELLDHSPITMSPRNGCPRLASATKPANSQAGVLGNGFQKSGSRYGRTSGGLPAMISSCMDAPGGGL